MLQLCQVFSKGTGIVYMYVHVYLVIKKAIIMATTVFHPANKRGHANHGWLDARHSFSFAGWYDPAKIHFGALRVLNDDIVEGGKGFGRHPHDNMEIITIILDGVLEHKDSMGHTQTIVPGEVQVMSAGTGVTHSEYNHLPDKEVNVLQTWIFPNKRDVEPRYGQQSFAAEDRVNKIQTLVSPIDNADPGLKIHQNAWIYRTNLDAGKAVSHKLNGQDNGAYIFVISGQVKVNGQMLGKRDAFGISDTDAFEIEAIESSDVMIFEVPMTKGF
jgi:quercetin 2,3-dioxygenase